MGVFKVELEEAERFSKVWTKNGVSVFLTPEALEFAKDFSNVVLINFIQMCQAKATQEAARAAEANKSRIIMEGVR
jgi:hypothetical protein